MLWDALAVEKTYQCQQVTHQWLGTDVFKRYLLCNNNRVLCLLFSTKLSSTILEKSRFLIVAPLDV